MFDYDGDNDSGGYYDEGEAKSDRRFQATIWLGLLILFGALLAFSVSRNVGEIIMKNNANSVIGKFSPSTSTVSYTDANGSNHSVTIEGVVAEHNGEQITLYYYNNDYSKVKTVTWVWFWVFTYIFFGGIFLVSLVFYLKNIKQTHHYTGEQKKYTY